MQSVQLQRLHDMDTWLQANSTAYEGVQDINALISECGKYLNVMAFANGQMAHTKRALNEAKAKAYDSLIASQRAAGFDIAPSLAKDYISARLVAEQYAYDMAERCSRTCVHTLDTLRTCISALKEELRTLQYGGPLHA